MAGPPARPRPWPGRRRFRVTREGKLFLLTTLGLGVAAVNTGNNLLFLVLGLLLSLLLLSGILSDLALYRLEIRPTPPRRAFAGSPCATAVVVRNHKRWAASYALRFGPPERAAPGDHPGGSAYLLKVPPAAERTTAITFTPPRRGWMALDELVVGTSHPFGLIEKRVRIADATRLLVFPALVPSGRRLEVEALARLRADRVLERRGRGTELAGLREWAHGDEVRGIHWMRSAALGRLVTRERFQDAHPRVSLVVDNARPPDADARWDAAFERAVSEAAWLAAFALGRGLAVEVRARDRDAAAVASGTSPEPAWRFLAELEPVPAGDAVPLDPGGGPAVVLVPAR